MKKVIILSLLISIGCTNKQKELEYLICKDSIQYWNYEWPRDRAEYYGFTFSFDKQGNVLKYSFNKEKNERRLFTDIQNDNKWSITKDSILSFMGGNKKIVKITPDTIYAINLKTKEKVSFIRVKGNLNIKK
ncbi:hypothetical protein AAYQ05_09100 [Flavobacterium sp. B11]|uniref:hypothetical protein n=1 Tax=Flavobacterium movens TaxID=214860 RepID=UPI0031D8C376